jgi:hypothetical protein
MTQENKKQLLRDLCARLPYGVKVESVFINPDTKERKSCGIEVFDATSLLMIRDGLGEFKPYLRPISSLTEEQKNEFNTKCLELQLKVIDDEIMYEKATEFEVDFYNKHHLDWRGLIPKGLAVDCTGLNIY